MQLSGQRRALVSAEVCSAAGLPMGCRHVLRGGGGRQARRAKVGAAAGLPLECARVHDGCRGRTPLSAQVGARPGLLVDRANLHRSRSRRTPADAKVVAGEWVPMGPACTRSRPHAGGGLDSVTSCDGVSDCALDPGTSDCGLAPRPCAAAEGRPGGRPLGHYPCLQRWDDS